MRISTITMPVEFYLDELDVRVLGHIVGHSHTAVQICRDLTDPIDERMEAVHGALRALREYGLAVPSPESGLRTITHPDPRCWVATRMGEDLIAHMARSGPSKDHPGTTAQDPPGNATCSPHCLPHLDGGGRAGHHGESAPTAEASHPAPNAGAAAPADHEWTIGRGRLDHRFSIGGALTYAARCRPATGDNELVCIARALGDPTEDELLGADLLVVDTAGDEMRLRRTRRGVLLIEAGAPGNLQGAWLNLAAQKLLARTLLAHLARTPDTPESDA